MSILVTTCQILDLLQKTAKRQATSLEVEEVIDIPEVLTTTLISSQTACGTLAGAPKSLPYETLLNLFCGIHGHRRALCAGGPLHKSLDSYKMGVDLH